MRPICCAGVLLEVMADALDHVVDLGADGAGEPPAGLDRQDRVALAPDDQLGPGVGASAASTRWPAAAPSICG